MRRFFEVNDVPDLTAALQEAKEVKANPFGFEELGRRKTLCLLFFNPSLRTRISTQRAAENLGMNVIVVNAGADSWALETQDGVVMDQGKSEHIREAAAVIGQYCDILGVRSFAGLSDREQDYGEEVFEKFARYSARPIISLESATRHPLQSFADLVTIEQYRTVEEPKVVLTWAPHPKALPQAVANSFSEWMRRASLELGYRFVVTHPLGYDLASEFADGVEVVYNQEEALDGADFVYAKNWSSYQDYGAILSRDESWTITSEKMSVTNRAKFMHCLPVRRNVIVADDVIDSAESIVVPQAANRVVAAQTVIKQMLEAGA